MCQNSERGCKNELQSAKSARGVATLSSNVPKAKRVNQGGVLHRSRQNEGFTSVSRETLIFPWLRRGETLFWAATSAADPWRADSVDALLKGFSSNSLVSHSPGLVAAFAKVMY